MRNLSSFKVDQGKQSLETSRLVPDLYFWCSPLLQDYPLVIYMRQIEQFLFLIDISVFEGWQKNILHWSLYFVFHKFFRHNCRMQNEMWWPAM